MSVGFFTGGAPRPRLDVVFVSHFDADHVNGLVALLEAFSVGTLVLPYVPLWQRLHFGFNRRARPDGTLMRFLANPAAFIQQVPGAEVEQVLHVPESPEQRPPSAIRVVPGDRPWNIIADTVEPSDDEQRAMVRAVRASGPLPAAQFLRPGGELRVDDVWTFIPYNDSSVKPVRNASKLLDFQREVEQVRDELLTLPSDATLTRLSELYDERFGRSSVKRNVISLFLYAGLPEGTSDAHDLVSGLAVPIPEGVTLDPALHGVSGRGQVLYTGDGFLNTPARLAELMSFFGHPLLRDLSCLQVMHHGAERNWHAGVAQALDPKRSVFSSDPAARDHHPHRKVVLDFALNGPIQVDRTNGFFAKFFYASVRT